MLDINLQRVVTNQSIVKFSIYFENIILLQEF